MKHGVSSRKIMSVCYANLKGLFFTRYCNIVLIRIFFFILLLFSFTLLISYYLLRDILVRCAYPSRAPRVRTTHPILFFLSLSLYTYIYTRIRVHNILYTSVLADTYIRTHTRAYICVCLYLHVMCIHV